MRPREERDLSRRFKAFRIGGRLLHVCTTSSLAYHNLTQRRFPFSIYKERNERNGLLLYPRVSRVPRERVPTRAKSAPENDGLEYLVITLPVPKPIVSDGARRSLSLTSHTHSLTRPLSLGTHSIARTSFRSAHHSSCTVSLSVLLYQRSETWPHQRRGSGGGGGDQRSKRAIRSSCVAIVPTDSSCMIALAVWMAASA